MPMPEPIGPENDHIGREGSLKKDYQSILDGFSELFGLDASNSLDLGRTGALSMTILFVLSFD